MADLWARITDEPLDLVLWLSVVGLTIVAGLIVLYLVRLRRRLRGKPGSLLATIMVTIGVAVFLSQCVATITASMIVYDRLATIGPRVVLFILSEAIEVGGILYAVGMVRGLTESDARDQRNRDKEDAP